MVAIVQRNKSVVSGLIAIQFAVIVGVLSLCTVTTATADTTFLPTSQPIEAQSDVAGQDVAAPTLLETSAKTKPEAAATLAAPAPDPLQIWRAGLLGATQKVADSNLAPISLSLGGYKVFKSNNPEIFYGPG